MRSGRSSWPASVPRKADCSSGRCRSRRSSHLPALRTRPQRFPRAADTDRGTAARTCPKPRERTSPHALATGRSRRHHRPGRIGSVHGDARRNGRSHPGAPTTRNSTSAARNDDNRSLKSWSIGANGLILSRPAETESREEVHLFHGGGTRLRNGDLPLPLHDHCPHRLHVSNLPSPKATRNPGRRLSNPPLPRVRSIGILG